MYVLLCVPAYAVNLLDYSHFTELALDIFIYFEMYFEMFNSFFFLFMTEQWQWVVLQAGKK